MPWLFSKKLRKRVVVALSVPLTEQALAGYRLRGSDFFSTLKGDGDKWKDYSRTAEGLSRQLGEIRSLGADVIESFASDDFHRLAGYDIIILIVHHTLHGTVELADGEMDDSLFVRQFPQGFGGIIDLSSCQSKSLIEMIKYYLPESHILGVNAKTALLLKGFIIRQVLELMAKDRKLEYLDAYLRVLDLLDRYKAESGQSVPVKEDVVYLGSENEASLYAPSSVVKGQDFIIQLFLHSESARGEVDEEAAMIDEDATLRNRKQVRLPLEKGDLVEVQLATLRDNGDFLFDKAPQGAVYDGGTVSFEFIVSVSETCCADAFIGKVKIAVNNQMAGDMALKVKIAARASHEPCSFEYTPRDRKKERMNEQEILYSKLQAQMQELAKQKEIAADKAAKQSINQMEELCRTCLNLIHQSEIRFDDKYKTVFVSSTSDMKPYRIVVREEILSCEMHPEMYEDWRQGNAYPCDECCRRVINSDIVLCILGARYGFVEPSIGMSMTEIEYRVASLFGKDVLVYITDRENASGQQKEFLDEVCKKRLVRFFSSERNLAESAGKELTILKYHQSWNY